MRTATRGVSGAAFAASNPCEIHQPPGPLSAGATYAP